MSLSKRDIPSLYSQPYQWGTHNVSKPKEKQKHHTRPKGISKAHGKLQGHGKMTIWHTTKNLGAYIQTGQ